MAESSTFEEISQVGLIKKTDKGIEFILSHLQRILCQKHCKNKKVVVISTTGSRRIGKTFLLNYMMRYLRDPKNDQWMGEKDTPLTGFLWKGGTQRVTIGMNTFNTLFPLKLASGEKVFVMLLDTEGSEDLENTVDHSAKIFALSALVSSMLVHSIDGDINLTVLDTMKLFADYSKQAEQNSSGNPLFQNLVMLVRNFKHHQRFPFGWEGGEQYWKYIGTQSKKDHADTYEAINSTSETIKCYLLPYPGEEMDENIEFNGSRGTLTKRFHDGMEKLVSDIINEAIANPKTINGETLTCGDLYVLCENYSNLFRSGNLPQIRGIDEANAVVHLHIVYQECIKLFEREIKRKLQETGKDTLESWDNTYEKISVEVVDKLQAVSVSSNKKLQQEKVEDLRECISNNYKVLRDEREKEIELDANMSDNELYNVYHDDYVKQMDGKLPQCSDVEEIRTFHKQFKRQAVESLEKEMISKTPRFLKEKVMNLKKSIAIKHEADRKWMTEVMKKSNAECYKECQTNYKDNMRAKQNAEGHFNSTAEMRGAHTDAKNLAKELFDGIYKGVPDRKDTTWNEILCQLNETYKQFEVSQMNHENLMLSAINHDASKKAKSVFIDSIQAHFLEEDEFDLFKCLAEARALAMTSWNREHKGSPNDYHPIQKELSYELDDLEYKYKTCYDMKLHKQKKIRDTSALISIIGLLGGPLGLAISTPFALRFQKKELKKLRGDTSLPKH